MDLNGIMRRQLFCCFDMFENLINKSPDEIWNAKKGGFIFWQQIYHALCGALYWFRTETGEFYEPYSELNLFPELEKSPENQLSKIQILEILSDSENLAGKYLDRYNSEQLLRDSVLLHSISCLDAVIMQIRHLQHHIGHCESILREEGIKDLEWIDII